MLDELSPVSPRNKKNIVLNEAKTSPETISKISKEYIEGGASIPLPSKGIFYSWNQQFFKLETLSVRQLNYTDEDILTTKSYLDDGSVFTELLKNTILTEDFPATGLVPVDRDTILLWLRSTAFGNEFKVEIKCPVENCGHKNIMTWDLGKLEIPTFDEEVFRNLEVNLGEYEIITPLKEVRLKLVVPSVGKSREFEKTLALKKKNLNSKTDFYGTGSLSLIVASVFNEEKQEWVRSTTEIQNYFNKINLPLADSRFIRKELEKINLTYETKQDCTCEACGYIQEGVVMPMLHPNFLWVESE